MKKQETTFCVKDILVPNGTFIVSANEAGQNTETTMSHPIIHAYRQTYNISRTKSPNLNVCLAVVFAQFIEAWWSVENEDVFGAAPQGDAPTTSEWSRI